MKTLFLSIALLICYSITATAQVKNLDKVPQPQRDSILMEVAKKAILHYGAEFYEKDRIPTIKRVPFKDDDNVERMVYRISYNEDEEYYKAYPNAPKLAEVFIWEGSGEVYSVMFQGRGILGLDKEPEHKFFKEVKRRYLTKK